MIKKVLIMSASTGGGHNRAARAIKEELESRTIDNMSIECEIVDSLKLVNNTMDKVISRGYEKSALYTPKAYGSVYRFSETTIASKNEFKTNPLTSLMARKFKHLLNESTPDLIIGTHPFPMIALSTLKKNNNIHSLSRSESFYKSTKVDIPPMISVLTDYTTHSTWIQNEIDYYIVGHEYVKELLVYEGVDSEKVKAFGIPVEKSFLSHRDRETVLTELGLSPEKLTVLLMGGSFGAGNIKETLEDLIAIDRDFQILVITGRNEHLKDKLSKMLDSTIHNKNICLLGYTNKMNDILASIDVLISKPGGLTTTEALLNDVPMIVPYFIPGQEEENAQFLEHSNIGIWLKKQMNITETISNFISNDAKLKQMKENTKKISNRNSTKDICTILKAGLN